MRELADQAFSRAAGAALVTGNSIRVLRDARENYPAWLDAIARASRSIHFESYIIHDDDDRMRVRAGAVAKARAGVRVRVIYDWLGASRQDRRRFWNAPARGRRRGARASIGRGPEARLAGSVETTGRC